MLVFIHSCLCMVSSSLFLISLLLPKNNSPLDHLTSCCNKWQRNGMHRGISRKLMPETEFIGNVIFECCNSLIYHDLFPFAHLEKNRYWQIITPFQNIYFFFFGFLIKFWNSTNKHCEEWVFEQLWHLNVITYLICMQPGRWKNMQIHSDPHWPLKSPSPCRFLFFFFRDSK